MLRMTTDYMDAFVGLRRRECNPAILACRDQMDSLRPELDEAGAA
jgi:hypothetical protein